MWVRSITRDRRNSGLLWTIFEGLGERTKFFNHFRLSVDTLRPMRQLSFLYIKEIKDTNIRKYHPKTDQQ